MDETDEGWIDERGYFWGVVGVAVVHMALTFVTVVILINANIPDTKTWGLDFGTYFSLRFTSGWWIMYFLQIFRVMVGPTVLFLLLFRNESCCGKRGRWSIFWAIILVTLLMLEVVSLVIAGSYYSTRNSQQLPQQNPASALEACCVVSVWTDPSNNCPVTAPGCPANMSTFESLPNTNGDFLFQWMVTIFTFLCDLTMAILSILMWTDDTLSKEFRGIDKKEQDSDDDRLVDQRVLLLGKEMDTMSSNKTRKRR